MSGPHVFLVAAERSGDLLGAGLGRELRSLTADKIRLSGIGGSAMAEQGIESAISIDGLSILGWIDGLKAYSRVKQAVSEAVDAILAAKPDVVVLIDSWGFTLRVAQGVRAADPAIRLVKYVGPQVFATRPGRAETLAASVDELLTILSFDAPYYEAHGLPVTFVGNPTLERLPRGDGAAFRSRHGIAADEAVLVVLPGSRPSEIRRMMPPMVEALKRLTRGHDDLRLVLPVADPVADQVDAAIAVHPVLQSAIRVGETEKADAFASADLALACSGTVVTELATAGVPTITGYKLGWITWGLVRAFNLLKTPHISLVNIAADARLVPEIIQLKCTGKVLADEVERLLADPVRRAELSVRLQAVTSEMRGSGQASRRAAEAVLAGLD
ncbi:lipid-A-disaccharide synthase [Maricaulis sp.]|jgi:lipid-A-disaccharide synthase|uniref:lipid-A-disaccharide synthase n=1 Tax=Maricaulis sp. TaxID=1486257 RepID=UPI00262E826B|nr:lipid-A-disaccharide synthase [Maricaulis sp.]MDF1767249.1 lipid-A-disaccharide synthase [Maricaulis sp.]